MKKYTEQFESIDRLRQSNVSSVSYYLQDSIYGDKALVNHKY